MSLFVNKKETFVLNLSNIFKYSTNSIQINKHLHFGTTFVTLNSV